MDVTVVIMSFTFTEMICEVENRTLERIQKAMNSSQIAESVTTDARNVGRMRLRSNHETMPSIDVSRERVWLEVITRCNCPSVGLPLR